MFSINHVTQLKHKSQSYHLGKFYIIVENCLIAKWQMLSIVQPCKQASLRIAGSDLLC